VLINWLPESSYPQFDFVKGINLATYLNQTVAVSGGLREVEAVPGMTGQITVVSLHYTIQRTAMVRFFSMFVVLLMWLLSTFVVVMAIDHVIVRPRQVLPPTIGFTVSMLFALPAVRNTQPGIPNMGCLVDVAGFFWNMAMISVAVLLLLSAFVGQHTSEGKAEPH
jgi:hypothetical protein